MKVNVTENCDRCSRIPVLDEDEMQWLMTGQPLSSLIAEAYERSHLGFSSSTGEVNTDTVASMNSVMDNLESLFGFAKTEKYSSLTEQDVHNPSVFYSNGVDTYLSLPSERAVVHFCPFCGRKFTDK